MAGLHSLTEETMAQYVGKGPGQLPIRFAMQAGYDKLRRCKWCLAYLEPEYAAMTACVWAPEVEDAPRLHAFFMAP